METYCFTKNWRLNWRLKYISILIQLRTEKIMQAFLRINSMLAWTMEFGRKNSSIIIYCRLIARANLTRKSRYNILPPTGTRAKYMSKLIKHNAFPFIGNFCANSGVGSSPSDNDKLMSHCHTCARVQSRGSVKFNQTQGKTNRVNSWIHRKCTWSHVAASNTTNTHRLAIHPTIFSYRNQFAVGLVVFYAIAVLFRVDTH